MNRRTFLTLLSATVAAVKGFASSTPIMRKAPLPGLATCRMAGQFPHLNPSDAISVGANNGKRYLCLVTRVDPDGFEYRSFDPKIKTPSDIKSDEITRLYSVYCEGTTGPPTITEKSAVYSDIINPPGPPAFR